MWWASVYTTPFGLTKPLFVPEYWNPIYPGIAAIFTGGLATMWCRPDLKTRTWVGALLFLAIYILFLLSFRLIQPGYIEQVWNLSVLTGINILGMPLDELLFASGFGLYWAGVYEPFTWQASYRYHEMPASPHSV